MVGTDNWVLFALVTLVLWGCWGFLYKAAGNHITYQDVLVYSVIGASLSNAVILLVVGLPESGVTAGSTYALLGGLFGAIGGLTFLFAVQHGRIAVVAPMTALYPVVTILLGVAVLNEAVTPQKALGIVFAVAAMLLLGT